MQGPASRGDLRQSTADQPRNHEAERGRSGRTKQHHQAAVSGGVVLAVAY